MHFTDCLNLRRIYNYSFHPFRIVPKPSNWLRRERLFRFNAWTYGNSRFQVKAGYQKVNKTFIYMDMHRKDKPMLEYHYAIQRLIAAVGEHNSQFPIFKTMLDRAHINIDNRALAILSLYEPRTFQILVELSQKMALHCGAEVYPSEAELEHIAMDNRLLEEPFPRAKIFNKGPSANHKQQPRRLKESEY